MKIGLKIVSDESDMRREVKNRSIITPRILPKATERKELAFRERRDHRIAGLGKESKRLVLEILSLRYL